MLTGIALQFLHLTREINHTILDREFTFLRAHYPQPANNDVVVVGIDSQTFTAFHEPFALWHPHLEKFLDAMATARPAVLGMDIVLPSRSYHFLIPQYDRSLLMGLMALKSQSPVVLGQTMDDNGQFRQIFPPYVAVAGADSLASVMVCLDGDGVIRRFDESLCDGTARARTLVGKMAERLGVKEDWNGLVDYSVGNAFTYVPFLKVLDWYELHDEASLAATFRSKPVLLGVVLPFSDRLTFPVALAAWEPENHRLPGVLFHAQALRSMMNHGLVRAVPQWLTLLLCAAAALLWFGKGWSKTFIFIAFIPGMAAISLLELWQSHYLPTGGILISGCLAYGSRWSYEAIAQMKERRRLRNTFGHYVSPQVLREIMNGNIRPGLGGNRKPLCLLFADIRNFTARAESMPPEEVIRLLNAYFSEMTAAVHKHGGTVDKFIGDGIMAFFGAPQQLECPEKNALEAAQEMLLRLQHFNRTLQERSIEPVRIGVGLHSGEALIGHVGSESRNEYTAIGDVVNVASRLEGLTKTLGYAIICSDAVANAVGKSGGLKELGEQPVKGHTVVTVFGWNPPILSENEKEA